MSQPDGESGVSIQIREFKDFLRRKDYGRFRFYGRR